MVGYRLVLRKSVAKDLRSVPKKDLARILKRIKGLASDPRPHGCEKLVGEERYRIRQGIYRIIYTVIDEEICVVVVIVAHRREVYR